MLQRSASLFCEVFGVSPFQPQGQTQCGDLNMYRKHVHGMKPTKTAYFFFIIFLPVNHPQRNMSFILSSTHNNL